MFRIISVSHLSCEEGRSLLLFRGKILHLALGCTFELGNLDKLFLLLLKSLITSFLLAKIIYFVEGFYAFTTGGIMF